MVATNSRTYTISRVGHVVLRVRDIERSEPFYRDVLGLKISHKTPGRAVFFTCGEQDHDLAIFQLAADAPGPEDHRVGMYHTALRLGDVAELKAFFDHARESGANIVGINHHGGSKSIYLKDPDGLEFEVYCETDEPGTEETLRRELGA